MGRNKKIVPHLGDLGGKNKEFFVPKILKYNIATDTKTWTLL
jgi:hypothetical protein